ncbi:hypothetical protein J416_09981 [Gracilibacillus halophilus YIM-C55.5]|uniref:Uncharacterized protein n=1 Tax=Gracilibacillus halophilus YIM-C55.5 TaxID=1308866 RepID=N4WBH6_9BACI|nr:SafA/ExsA family spore coat assembly protein [Gracilibacillus halophilus]ENH96584.1 hypothetical protein J416_09981 [Gracilibacillus halophilus YIM-C55.5]
MKIHIVQQDETLWKIAQKYGVHVDDLIAANPQISNPDMIMPGMKIKVPTSTNKEKQKQQPQTQQPQTMPNTEKKKQEVKPEQTQITPEITEDEGKKWEPLKKEMPSLPFHLNQMPINKEQSLENEKWNKFNDATFDKQLPPMPEEPSQVGGAQEQPQQMPQAQQMPMQQPQMQAPCYSSEGIPYGYGGQMMGPMAGGCNEQPMMHSHHQMPPTSQMPMGQQSQWQPGGQMQQPQWNQGGMQQPQWNQGGMQQPQTYQGAQQPSGMPSGQMQQQPYGQQGMQPWQQSNQQMPPFMGSQNQSQGMQPWQQSQPNQSPSMYPGLTQGGTPGGQSMPGAMPQGGGFQQGMMPFGNQQQPSMGSQPWQPMRPSEDCGCDEENGGE